MHSMRWFLVLPALIVGICDVASFEANQDELGGDSDS
jgi:hypothetical protein